jgi:hypothetical protein
MYKDDNVIGGCSDSLLRMMMEGRGNSCPVCEGEGCSHREGCNGGCDKSGSSWGLHGYPLASVYAPLQEFDNIYDINTALKQGTVFKELDLPFMGNRRVSKGGNCRG